MTVHSELNGRVTSLQSKAFTRPFDRLLFGDNQFFGINHMSEEKARAQAVRFQDLSAVMSVLDSARDAGIRTFMCTTHDRVAEICDVARGNPGRYGDMLFFPCMPYAHKYANAVTDLGVFGAMRKMVPEGGIFESARRGTMSLARKDIEGLTTLLIDAEMKMFSGLETPVVFLQNVVVDLLVGLGMGEPLGVFADYVRAKYGAEPGYITMNLPALMEVLDQAGVDSPVVCANFNKLGFRMCGGADAYAHILERPDVRFIAMSVLASGAIPAQEAISWVCAQPGVESIVFGASSATNIRSTYQLVAERWGECPGGVLPRRA